MGIRDKRTGRRNKGKTNRKLILFGAVSAGVIFVIIIVFVGLNYLGKTDEATRLKRVQNGEEPLNVIIISIDTLRSDYVSCYGSNKVDTPNMDRFASEGIMFSGSRCAVPQTLPSHVSLMTGTYPQYHGVIHNHYRVSDDVTTLAEILKGEGYDTGAVIGAFPLDKISGFDQGFDSYDCTYTKGLIKEEDKIERRAEEVWQTSKDWLDENSDEEFFLFIHMYDPHYPYEPPHPYNEKFAEDLYAGEVKYVDEVIGEIWDYLKRSELDKNTLVIILSDHGEGLMDHGELEHGYFIYEESLRVPLILRCPGLIPAGKKVDGPVGLIDVMPTILEILGLQLDIEIQGVSLVDYIYSNKRPDFPLYAESRYPTFLYGWQSLYSYTSDGWKYIEAPKPELYNLMEDPGETNNLLDEFPEKSMELSQALNDFVKDIPFRAEDEPGGSDLSDSDIAKLTTLGYLSSAGLARPPLYPDIDPKDKIEFHELSTKYIENMKMKNYEKAEGIFEEILKLEPDHFTVNSIQAKKYQAQKRYVEAEKYVERALEQNPDDIGLRRNLADIYKETSRIEAASEIYEGIINDDTATPKDIYRAFIELGKIELYITADYEAATEYFNKAKTEIPALAMSYYFLALTHSRIPGNEDEAVKYGKTFLAREPDSRYANQIQTLIDGFSAGTP